MTLRWGRIAKRERTIGSPKRRGHQSKGGLEGGDPVRIVPSSSLLSGLEKSARPEKGTKNGAADRGCREQKNLITGRFDDPGRKTRNLLQLVLLEIAQGNSGAGGEKFIAEKVPLQAEG